MSQTVFHTASRTWLSAAYAAQLDAALAAAREVGRCGRPRSSGSGVLRTTPNSLITDEPWNFITGKNAGALERLDKLPEQYIETAPVIPPEEAGPEKVRQLINLVDQLIALRQQLAAPGSPHETENRKNQLAALTATLDTAVAELYGVSE